MVKDLSGAGPAEGWDGKSIRQHIDSVSGEAAEARQIAEGAQDEIATLRAEVIELAAKVARNAAPCSEESDEEAAGAMKRASLFGKVKFIQREISSWQYFMVEVNGIRGALREWRVLEAQLKGSRE